MDLLKKINRIDVFFWISVFFIWLVIRLPFFFNPIANIDLSLTVAETICRLFANTPPIFSLDEGIFKLLFVLPVLFFTREFLFLGIPPMIFSFLSVVLTYVLALVLFDKRSARYSVILLIFSVWHADYSTYVKMYTLYSCVSLMWVLLFVNFLKKQTMLSNILFWSCAFIALYSYIPYVVFVFVFPVWLYLINNQSKLKSYSKGFLVFFIWLIISLLKVIKIFIYRQDLGSAIISEDFFKSLINMFFARDNLYLFLVLVLLGMFFYRREKNVRFFMLILSLLISAFLFFYLTYFLQLAFFSRYLFFVYSFWLILCGATLGYIHKRKPFFAILLLCLSLLPIGQKVYLYLLKKEKITAIRTIHSQEKFYKNFDEKIKQYGQKGDLVIMDSFVMCLGFQHYTDVENHYPVGMFSFLDKRGLFFEHEQKFIHISDDLENYMLDLKKHYKRIWVVLTENPQAQLAFESNELKHMFYLDGFKVYLLEYSFADGIDILSDFEKHYLHYPFERN